MFPEGTRLKPGTLKKVIVLKVVLLILQSQEHAKKNNLQVFNNVLLPRTKGFNAFISEFRESHVKFVYGSNLPELH